MFSAISRKFLDIALNTKCVPGYSIIVVCRSVSNNFIGDVGLTFLPMKLVGRGVKFDGVIK